MVLVYERLWFSPAGPPLSSPIECVERPAVNAAFSAGFGIVVAASYSPPPGAYGIGSSIGDGFATPEGHGYYFMGPANEYDDAGIGSPRVFHSRWTQNLDDAGTSLVNDYVAAQTTVPVLITDPSITADNPVPTSDELTLYVSTTDATSSVPHIQVATRASTSDSFGALTPVHELDSAEGEYPSWISPDQCRLYVTRKVGGQYDLFVATRTQ